MKVILAIIASVSGLALPATAEEGKWKGEGSFSAGLNTGNTETSDLGIGLKMSTRRKPGAMAWSSSPTMARKMAARPRTGCFLQANRTAH